MRTGEQIVADVAGTVAERRKGYGHPKVNFDRIATGWSQILKCDVTARQVALAMAWLKISRLIETPGHEDSVLDLMGYAVCYADCGGAEVRLTRPVDETINARLDRDPEFRAALEEETRQDTADPAWLDAPLPDYMTYRTCERCCSPVLCKTKGKCHAA